MENKPIRKPDFFIVGAPRCGTTAMYEYLKQHPEIYMPERAKEPHFFCKDFKFPNSIREEARYLALFSKGTNKKRVGEASATYLYSKVAAIEIKKFNPEARIIIMLRNPVDMIYSLHSHMLFAGVEEIEDFEEALKAEEDRKKGLRIPNTSWPTEFLLYREVAKYSVQIKRYYKHFDKKSIHVIIFDDLKKAPDKVYKATLRFLEVDENFKPEFKIINPNKKLRSSILRSLLFPPPKFIQNLSRVIIPSSRLRETIYNILTNYSVIYTPRKPINAELRKKLIREFAKEIEQVSDLINRDLSFWLEE